MQRFQKLVQEKSKYRERDHDPFLEELQREREYRAFQARSRSPIDPEKPNILRAASTFEADRVPVNMLVKSESLHDHKPDRDRRLDYERLDKR